MDWRDTGILLSVRRHGESSAILDVFTETRGRHAGVLRGATSRKIAPTLQPGSELDLHWRARLEDHIGTYHAEPRRSRAAQAMADPVALAGLNAVTSLLSFALPERQAHADLYRGTGIVLDTLGNRDLWPLAYLRWEVLLLEQTGFALDLGECAVTGRTEGLAYVSPRTGRAVTAEGAGAWADRLLPLPPVLAGSGNAAPSDIVTALETTGHFLTHHLAPSLGEKPLPTARALLLDRLRRAAGDGPAGAGPALGG
ncbi:DNA repair protein RecO [Roseivivax marinus]|uniref:DNA repair protein RecO n=1 Tax=Roseivivax marinus TaxID=1379903 RepID=W4HJK1_9RHOB|nr:DNA repair protein RecO [Roseivivax marinus]ETW12175.1 DNA repair protein RecO [Roseivivax marinus]SEL24890.1 DNA replication and repair protein RecO [Roseivivax marinus]